MSIRRPALRSCSWAAACLAVFWATLPGAVTAQDSEGPVSSRMLRQIKVIEGIIDEVLVESPNFRVSGRDDTRGLYLEGYGVVLMFEATLVDVDDWDDWSDGFRYEVDKDGRTIVVIPDKGKGDTEDEDGSRRSWRDRRGAREKRLYERGKQEIREALLDYGDTMTTLADGQWLAVAAFLKDTEYFMDNKMGRVVIRAKMSDLRAYAAGKIREEAMLERFVEEEY